MDFPPTKRVTRAQATQNLQVEIERSDYQKFLPSHRSTKNPNEFPTATDGLERSRNPLLVIQESPPHLNDSVESKMIREIQHLKQHLSKSVTDKRVRRDIYR